MEYRNARLSEFRRIIEDLPPGASTHSSLVLMEDGKYRTYYTPFEFVNPHAKLVVVGITPGPNQLELALEEVQRARGEPEDVALVRAKKQGSFGSATMRPNLLRMLKHFRVDERLGLNDVGDLWSSQWDLFQGTSVVPHAAFEVGRDGALKPFNGSFDTILKSRALRACFEESFVPTVSALDRSALWVALGPQPKAALDWCVAKGLLRANQVAAFTHPSTNGGSQVAYFLREKARADFKPQDPVLSRCDWLDEAYAATRSAFDAMLPLQPIRSGGRVC